MRRRAVRHRGASVLLPFVLGAAPLAAPTSSAAQTGPPWVPVALPLGYTIPTLFFAGPITPMACTPATTHCVAITARAGAPGTTGEYGTMVTTNFARWTGRAGIPANTESLSSLACPTTTRCIAVGIAYGGAPLLAVSSNGGATFTETSPPGNGEWFFSAISCATATECYLAGGVKGSGPSVGGLPAGSGPLVAVTHDGGKTWTRLDTAIAGRFASPAAISCPTAAHCVVAGTQDRGGGFILTTADGGRVWHRAHLPEQGELLNLSTVSCAPGHLTCDAGGQLSTGAPVVLSTTDGGTTWVGLPFEISTGVITSLSCATPTRCWAAAMRSDVSLLGTADGGNVWQPIGPGGGAAWAEVVCATALRCAAETAGLLIATQSNGGVGPATGAAPAAPHSATTVAPVLATPTTAGVSVDPHEAESVARSLWRARGIALHAQDPRALAAVESGPALAVDAATCGGTCFPPPLPPAFGISVVVPHETTWPAQFLADSFQTVTCSAAQRTCNTLFVAVQQRPGAPWRITLTAAYAGLPIATLPPVSLPPPVFPITTLLRDYAQLLVTIKHTPQLPAGTVFANGPYTSGFIHAHYLTPAAAAQLGYSYSIRYTPATAEEAVYNTPLGALTCGTVDWVETDTPLAGFRILQLSDRSAWDVTLAPGAYRRVVMRGIHMDCFVPANHNPEAPSHKEAVLADSSGTTSSTGVR